MHRGCALICCSLLLLALLPQPSSAARKKFSPRFSLANPELTNPNKTLRAAQKLPPEFHIIYDKKLGRQQIVKNGILIRFKKKISEKKRKFYFKKRKLKVVSKLSERSYLCMPTKGKNMEEKFQNMVRYLNKASVDTFDGSHDLEHSWVESYGVNEYRKVSTNALVKTASQQWHLSNDGRNGLVRGADINAEEAWNVTQGLGVKVAVIDTGFDLKHKDINYAAEGFNALVVDEDGSGNTASSEAKDASAPNYSNENHGTAVAGIIAAKDNDKGVVGVAPKSEVIPIRLINDYGMVSVAQIAAAFRKADELGAKIINNSWGSYDPDLKEGEELNVTQVEQELYREIAEEGNNGKGIMIIFASGNSGRSDLANSPEARSPYTLSVGATDSTDQRASYSVYGEELDLVAPGGGSNPILTTDRRDTRSKRTGRLRKKGYSYGNIARDFTGTSAAAPVVAGVAALVWSVNPNLTAEQVKTILIETADKNIHSRYRFSNGKNDEIGYGRVNAGAAVDLARDY